MIKTIIHLDDEKYITDTLIAQLMSEFGNQYYYEAVDNVPEAQEVIDDIMNEDASVCLIISDQLMPKIKGDKFLMEVHEKYPDIKLILLSGLVEEDAYKRLEEANILNGMFKKPQDKVEMLDVIKKCLE